jgi:hypothetical protein
LLVDAFVGRSIVAARQCPVLLIMDRQFSIGSSFTGIAAKRCYVFAAGAIAQRKTCSPEASRYFKVFDRSIRLTTYTPFSDISF